jgi:drug/metabolite transporter (DMT)-like permease
MTALPAPGTRRQTLTGMACAVGGSAVFSLNDIAVKDLSGDYALHELILIRSLIGMAVVVLVLAPFQGGFAALRSARPGPLLLRGLFVVASNLCYFLGLAALPLADTVAIFFVAPLLVTALSVPLLGERVGPRRWAAVCVGLLGVVVMIRPGGAFHWAALLPLGSALFYALMHMMTRRLRTTDTALSMALHVQVCFVLVCAGMGLAFGDGRFAAQSDPSLAFLFRAWIWPDPGHWLHFLASGLSTAIGGLLIAQAYRLCEAGLAAPFEYASVPIAVFWGLVLFGEWPQVQAWVGMALICGAGLYMFWREMTRAGQGG